jgi:dolichyl-phosphate beta-glucosyltransferase
MQKNVELSVIIPVFNEELEIIKNLQTVEKKLRSMGISYEIIVVDDGSIDQTLNQVRSYPCREVTVLSYEKNQGKGFAVRHGMLRASGQYRLFMDIDLSTSLEAFDSFLNEMRKNTCDILIGDRKSNPDHQTVKQPFFRRFLGRGFTGLSCLCVGKNINDFTCGFKMFNKKSSDIIFHRQLIYRWAFDTELIYIALLHGLCIRELPVIWQHHGDSTVRPLRDVITSLSELIKIKFNAWKGLYR